MRPVYFDGAFRDTPVYDRATLPPGLRLDGPAVVEEFGSTTVVFPGQHLDVDPHGILIVRSRQAANDRSHGAADAQPHHPPPHPSPARGREQTDSLLAQSNSQDASERRSAPRRSDRAADRRRHVELDRGRDRIRHRAHRALADDPRGARLPRRPVRPPLPQAHRTILFGDAERGGARFPAADHAAGRRVPDERHLSHRGQHRAPARPLQHGAGVPRRRGGRLYPGLRPPRRHRRARAGLDAGHGDDRVRGRAGGAADQALRRRPPQRGGVHHHQAQHPRARDARRRSRQRGAGLRDGRAPDGGAVRALRARDGRGLLPGHPRQVPRHLPQRAAAEDRRRRVLPGRTTSSTTASAIPGCTSSRSR